MKNAMKLSLYNSLNRKKQAFEPLDEDHIKIYVCGPTVYSYAHIGNARASVTFDLLRRVMKAHYPKVTYVSNITDIDDRIMDAAKVSGEGIEAITKKYTDIYNADMHALYVDAPDVQPHATAYVTGMVTMIETLIAKNHAYENDGHILFHVPSYKNYGQLSGRNRNAQIAGARVEVAPYKKDPADFVLWKPSTDDQPGWDSPWGRGRPGWHIECSVMAKELLGDVFDIHGGGLDLTFPHHENEIAQSCCANGQDMLARYWIHNGFVTVEGEKMSKSLGNVLLVHDLIAQGIPGEAIRLALLSTHYRQPFDWSEDVLNQSLKTLDKWYGAMSEEQSNEADKSVLADLSDDLNTPKAIASLHHLASHEPHKLKASANVMGLLNLSPEAWQSLRHKTHNTADDMQVQALIDKRNQARADKNFAEADNIRDMLTSMGVVIEDTANGTSWKYE
jgi:cysteinyl-tRNA synthetase